MIVRNPKGLTQAEVDLVLSEPGEEVKRMRALLAEVRDRGLIYWEPNTSRGHVAKADMLERIDAALGRQMDGGSDAASTDRPRPERPRREQRLSDLSRAGPA